MRPRSGRWSPGPLLDNYETKFLQKFFEGDLKFFKKEPTFRDRETKRWITVLENASDYEARKAGRRMSQCGSYRRARKNSKTGEYVAWANWCKSPFCSRCQYFRSRQKMFHLYSVIDEINQDETLQCFFLTLTPDHNSFTHDVKEEMKIFHKKINSLFKNGLFSHKVGHYRNSEITNRGEGFVHHHAHFLMHCKKEDISQVPGVKRLLNSAGLKNELRGYFLRKNKLLLGSQNPSSERIQEIISELNIEQQEDLKKFEKKQFGMMVTKLKNGEIPITLIISLAKKLGLGHQVNIQRADRKTVLELTKYNTKTIEYHGVDMENLFVGSKNVRWHGFCGQYAKIKSKLKRLHIEEKEIENDESWEDAGDLDELFEKELLKDESKRDPEIMKLHQAMVKAELVFSVAEDFESLDKVYEDLMRDGNSPPPF